jgi:hypothetical protein
MATRAITNISSGIYTREIDLTVVQQAAGTFAGAAIGLMEKGPAFEVMTSSSFGERIRRMGDLNPDFMSSYYAREFLEQANNYKEVRILGLEGYSEKANGTIPGFDCGNDKSFAIVYEMGMATARVAGVSPLIADTQSVAAILKPRWTSFTQYAEVDYVEVVSITQRDGVTLDATDDLFGLTIHYINPTVNQPITIPCSLRPETKEYIGRVFGYSPKDKAKVQGRTSPLWVEFVYPSTKRRTSATSTPEYFFPGTTTPAFNSLKLLEGDVTIQTSFQYPTLTIDTSATSLGSPTIITTTAPHNFTGIVPIMILSASGTNLSVVSPIGLSFVNTVFYAQPLSTTSFELFQDAALTTPVETMGVLSVGVLRQEFKATWEDEVMNLGGNNGEEVAFQTPITPWFVSDADVDGSVKRLFRFWAISDGEEANTEIKIEVGNINPAGNINFGSFDISVRQFSDREDSQRVVLESFTNLTMNPKSDNYILRRVGDGENFPLKSRYIFVELNEDEVLSNNELPYGVEGYPNVTGHTLPQLVWTTGYDLTKPITKQVLGLANNKTNMFLEVSKDYLSFKNFMNVSASATKGFHLNPNNNQLLALSSQFEVAAPDTYHISSTNTFPVSGLEKSRRTKFVVCMSGGFDGFNVYKDRSWADPTSKDFEALQIAVEVLSDNESLESDFSVLVTPDFNFVEHSAACELVHEMVQGRGDALYLPDFNYELEPNPETAKLTVEASNMKSNFTAIYYPYCQIEDSVNKVNIWAPASIIALATIAATATNENVWQPPAGSLRTVTSNLVRTRRRMKINDREILKSANINPITLFPGSGFEITESRTTQEYFSALSFVHNRLLLGYAKKALNQTLRPLLHQLNSPSLRNAFVNAVTPIFDRIKKLNGLEEFKVSVVEQEEDRTTLYGNIEIVPLYPVERIVVDFTLKNGSVEFSA